MIRGPARRTLGCVLCVSLLADAAGPALAAEIPVLPHAATPVEAPSAAAAAPAGPAAPQAAAPASPAAPVAPAAAAPVDAELRQAAAPDAAGRLFDGAAAAQPQDEGLDRYAAVVEHGVRSSDDVELALDLIRTVSPVFGKRVVDEARGRGIPITVTDQRYSHAEKTLHGLINRRSAWASAVRLRRGAPVLEVIHELAHAVPLRELPETLGRFEEVQLDAKAAVEELEKGVIRLATLEEGVAFASEILLARDLEKAGIAVDYEAVFPGAKAVFESGGVPMLAQYVPIRFPYYEAYFRSQAAAAAPLLKKGGDLLSTPWADRLDALGVETGRDRFAAAKASIDAEKARRAAADAVARGRLGGLTRRALDTLGGLLSKWRALPLAQDEAAPQVPPLTFAPVSRSALPEQRARLAQREQTIDRVRIAARFLDFLRRADESRKGDLDRTFSAAAAAAKRLEGEQTARLWTRLDAAARAGLKEKPDRLETLALALLDAGDEARGREALAAYADAARDQLYAVGQYGDSPLGKVLVEAAKASHLPLVRRLDALARERLTGFEESYRRDAMRGYTDYYGKLTDEGRRILDAELAAAPGHLTPDELRARLRALEERGLYSESEDGGAHGLSVSYEQHLFESLSKATALAEKLLEAAREVEPSDAGLAAELRRTASFADGLAMTGALGALDHAVRDAGEKFGVAFDGDLQAFTRALESSPKTNKDFSFANELPAKARSVGWALNRRGDALARSLPFYAALPDGEYKADLLRGALEKADAAAPASLVLRAAREWSRVLDAAASRRNPAAIGGSLDRGSQRDQQRLKKLRARLEAEAAAVGLTLDAKAALREFLAAYGDDSIRRQLPTMSEGDMAHVLTQFNADEKKFEGLLRRITGLGRPETKLALLETSFRALPGADYMSGRQIPETSLRALLAAADDALRQAARDRGAPTPPSLAEQQPPAPWRDSHYYREQRLAWALSLIRRGDRRLRALGRRALLDADGGTAPIASPRQLLANRGPLFGREPGGGAIYTLAEYRPAELKLPALLDAAEADWDHRADYLAQARALAPLVVVDASNNESWAVAQENLRALMRLAELSARDGRLDEAESLFQRVQQKLHALSLVFRARLDEAGKDDFYANDDMADIEFWIQDLDSRQSALQARWAWGVDEARARRRLDVLLEAFEKDAALRRDRFDARSMTAAAAALEEVPELRPRARRVYELATQKVALARGNKELFSAASDYLIDRVDKGRLDVAVKDSLLARAIRDLVPPKGKRGLLEIGETMPGLFDLAKRLIEEKRYPEAEKEILHVLAEVAEDVVFDAKDWKADAKLKGLEALFDAVVKADPEIARGESFPVLAGLSSDARYQEGLALLLPDIWKASRQAAGGALTREAIRSGLADLDDARARTLAAVDAASASGDASALRSALSLYREVLDRDLNLDLAARDGAARPLAELLALPGVAALQARLGAGAPEALAETLLGGSDPGAARARYALYHDLLGRADAPLPRRRLAFEGLVTAGKVSAYVESVFRREALAEPAAEARFYGWIRRLLDVNAGQLPPDEVLAYLFQNPGEESRFFSVLETSRKRKLLWRSLSGVGISHPDHDALDDFYHRTDAAGFEKRRQALNAKYDAWVPDMLDELELLVAHELGFHWTGSFQRGLDSLRAWYVDGVFDLKDRRKSYTAAKLEEWLAEVAPQVALTGPQRSYLDGLLKAEGRMSLAQLRTHLGVELAEEQGKRLMTLMHGERDFADWSVIQTWGPPPLSGQDRGRLADALKSHAAAHEARAEKMREDTIEVPEAFQKSVPLVRQALIAYFRQLAFGEREAVLADFDANGLTEAQAIKRFFEVTGNEKLGQFLSLRRDLVPEEYRRELESFQENVQASSFDEVGAAIENELGRPLEQVFAWVSPRPLKVGTIGEVYEVRLLDGSRGVVKVITPSRRKSIRRNLERLKAAAAEVDRNAHRFERRVDASRLYAEFERTINEELDLTLERRNALELSRGLPAGVTVPAMPEALNTRSVLVQGFADGSNPLELPPDERQAALRKLSDAFLEQVLARDAYHDDLHPGNIRVAADGTVILLDFGRVGRLTAAQRAQLPPLLLAVSAKDSAALTQRLLQMGQAGPDLDRAALARDLAGVLQKPLSPTAMTSALFFEAGRHGLEIDSAYLQLVKAIMTFEGAAHELDPSYDLEAAVRAKALARLWR